MSNKSYPTEFEAERAIAEMGKAGFLKPVHLPGRRWLLADNKERTISRSMIFHMLTVHYQREGTKVHPATINIQADEIFAAGKAAAAKRRK